MIIWFYFIAAIDASDAKTNETSSSVDSQIKDSSNSFRRRHSSEGVDAKFSSTLPKDSAVKCTNVRYTMKTRMMPDNF